MNVAGLTHLQAVDLAAHALVNRRARLAERTERDTAVAAATKLTTQIAAAQADSDAADQRIDDVEKRNHDLDTKRARLEGQLKTVIAPREAEALMHEIATLNEHRSTNDDEELEAMESQAAAQQLISELDAQLPDATSAVAAANETLAAAEADIDHQLAQHAAQRVEIVGALAADDVSWYDAINRHHQGHGIATLEGTRCSGCHLDLSRGELDVVKAVPADEFAECPQCSRALAR